MNISIENPEKSDGEKIWKLIGETGGLDLNSSYCYFMLGEYFGDTCAKAVDNDSDEVVGFVSGFRKPDASDSLFIWQVCVSKKAQGNGVAKRMIQFILSAHPDIRFIETTVGPTNTASDALFCSIARKFDATVRKDVFLDHKEFTVGAHETELLYKIGPFKN